MRLCRDHIIRLLYVAALAALPPAAATAQCPSHSFAAQPPLRGEEFGAAVAIVGDRAVVGGPGRNRVHPYRYTGGQWMADEPIAPLSGRFGESLALGESHLIAGAAGVGLVSMYAAPAPGAAEWTLEAEIEIPVPRYTPTLAMMTGADGARRAVIASFFGDPAAPRGSVIILRCNEGEWMEEARITRSWGLFGFHLAAQGDTLVVGEGSWFNGSVHIFHRDETWRQTAELTEEVPSPLSYASDVALRDNVLAVSASYFGFGLPGTAGGRVYIYRRGGSSAEWKLEGMLEGWASAFGWRLAFAGSRLAVLEGAPPIGLYESKSGVWLRLETLNPPAISDLWSLAGDPGGDGLVAGEPYAGDSIGAAHIYSMTACYCRADLTGDGRLDFLDFLEFQTLFATGDPRADFDGSGELDFFDFLAFEDEFAAGCS